MHRHIVSRKPRIARIPGTTSGFAAIVLSLFLGRPRPQRPIPAAPG
jgi:hypothetical protein